MSFLASIRDQSKDEKDLGCIDHHFYNATDTVTIQHKGPMTETEISDDIVMEVVEHIEIAELDGEAVLLDVKAGEYYGLNQLGSVIMGHLKDPMSVTQLKEAILQEFEVGNDQLDVDLQAFLSAMLDHNLLEIKSN